MYCLFDLYCYLCACEPLCKYTSVIEFFCNDIVNADATIKQSDVVLLGYPLMMEMSRDVRKNDLEIYEEVSGAVSNPHPH